MDWKSLVTGHIESTEKPLIVVLGPTASGKTGFSIELCQFLQGQPHRRLPVPDRTGSGAAGEGGCAVVNGDSRQLYKYLNIGTAKIIDEEKQGIEHVLFDVLDPREEATAGWYQIEAKKVIGELHAGGKVPVLVGGSMLYISTITDGLTMSPTQDEVLREKLMEEYDMDDGASLYERLKTLDPEAAARVHQQNKPRLVRAVEICELTRNNPDAKAPRTELRSEESSCEYDLLIFGIHRDREELVERINARTKLLLESGWIEEVQDLLEQGYTADDPGMKSHGYREIIQMIKQGDLHLDKLTEEISAKTRQYAKRQMTWWRGDGRIRWLEF